MRRLVIALLLGVAAGAHGATFNVTTLADSGPGSLRDAVAQANTAPGADTITFGVSGTITLTSGHITIQGPLSIQGPGPGSLTIDGNAASRIFVIYAGAGACPSPSAPSDFTVAVSGVTLRNARNASDTSGGAIQAFHSLALDSVVIRDNRAKVGAGLAFHAQYPNQSLTIANSQIVDNTAAQLAVPTTGFVGGGGVAVADHCVSPRPSPVPVAITGTLLSGNRVEANNLSGRGGGLLVQAHADVQVNDSRIVGNVVAVPTAPDPGSSHRAGALAAQNARSLRFERTEVAQNTAVTNSAFTLFTTDPGLQGAGAATAVTFVNSTITGNAGTSGSVSGNVLGNVAVELFNSTWAHNVPSSGTGNPGLFFSAQGGLASPTLRLESSILYNPAGGGVDISIDTVSIPGLDVTANRSLIGRIVPFVGQVDFLGAGTDNLLGLDPVLGPLAFNGGLTRTLLPLSASPVIDAGSNPLSLATDQRAGAFGRVAGPAPDIGAVEYPSSCFGFLDVAAGDTFCPSAAWLRNRNVTLGCTAGLYCPVDNVIRLAMAAFMNRLGTALSGTVVGTQQQVGALDPDDPEAFACLLGLNGEIPAAKYPRRAHVDALFAGIAAADAGLRVEAIAAFDWGGVATLPVLGSAQATFRGGQWVQVRTLGHVDVPAGQPLAVGLRAVRGGLPGTATLTDASCNVRVRLESRDGASAPFDH